MDWTLFWTAFGAIGTTTSTLITAIAVVIAVRQYKQPLLKKLRINLTNSYPIWDINNKCYFTITISNIGVRPVEISNIYIGIGNKKMVINNIMIANISTEEKIIFPQKLEQENSISIYLLQENIKGGVKELVNNKKIKGMSKFLHMKVLITDTTGDEYKHSLKHSVNKFIK